MHAKLARRRSRFERHHPKTLRDGGTASDEKERKREREREREYAPVAYIYTYAYAHNKVKKVLVEDNYGMRDGGNVGECTCAQTYNIT